MRYFTLIMAFFCLSFLINAEEVRVSEGGTISRQTTKQSIDKTFNDVMASLKRAGFSIVKEIDIGRNLKKASEEEGWPDYNKNNLVGIKTAIVCSGKTANDFGNADPGMVSICPLHVTLTQLGDWTNIDFIRPTVIAKGSHAEQVALKLEKRLNSAIHEGISTRVISHGN